jgi:ribose 5-phosphate isomerase B
MKVAIGADHAGVELKDELKSRLAAFGHVVVDVGTHGKASVDYPDFAAAVGWAVAKGAVERGVLVCGSGIGVAIAANKINGVRAANVHDLYAARLAREHNDANVVTLGARLIGSEHAAEIVKVFLETDFAGGRHAGRVAKISALET